MRNGVKRLLLAGFSIALALVAAELSVRLLLPEWASRTTQLVAFWQFDERLGWSHVPRASGRFSSQGFDVSVRINRQGFRGPDFPSSRTAGKTRVVVLGDSYVWGFGVEEDEIFTHRMEQLGADLEILNLGVSGYSTDQELLLFRDFGVSLEPDVVILMVAANDFEGNWRDRVYLYYHKPFFQIHEGELLLANQPVPRANPVLRAIGFMSRASFLVTQLGREVQEISESRKPSGSAVGSTVDSSARAGAASFPRNHSECLTSMLISDFVSAVRGAGARPIVTFTDGQGTKGRALAAALEPQAVTTVHLDDYMSRNGPIPLRLDQDFHWNAAGHEVVARALLEALVTPEI